MPNVGEILRTLGAKLDYDPELASYRLQMLRLLNEQHMALLTERPWTFAMGTAKVRTRSDITFGTVSITSGTRTLTGTSTGWTQECEGAWVYLADSNWYRVGRFAGATSLILDVPYTGTSMSGATYRLRWRYVPLPQDCVSYHNLSARAEDRGELVYVSRSTEEGVYLDEDTTGTTTAYTDADTWTPRSPDRPLTATASAGAGLVSGRTYRYLYTYMVNGVESAPCSPYVEVTPSGGNLQVTLSGFLDCDTGDGRQYALYRAESDVGIFYRIQTGTTSGSVIDTGLAVDRDAPLNTNGQRHYIRFYPRPGELSSVGSGTGKISYNYEDLEVRYHRRPRPLAKDSDFPEIPEDFHDVLVNRTLAEAFMKNGGDAQARHYLTLAKERERTMASRYISQAAHHAVRQGWTAGMGRFRYTHGPLSRTV